jgi:Protein of unknown function, DUF480
MRALTPLEARVLGVLVEKQHTVPDTYPLSLNALVAGVNQKTARDPVVSASEAEVLTADRQVYDLQHFLLKTALPPRELYRLMMKSYGKVVFRVIRRLGLWYPHVLFSPRILRVIAGLVRNQRQLWRAHRDVPQPQFAPVQRPG